MRKSAARKSAARLSAAGRFIKCRSPFFETSRYTRCSFRTTGGFEEADHEGPHAENPRVDRFGVIAVWHGASVR
jgi:hypothetical protein